jgi:hypothetical protein
MNRLASAALPLRRKLPDLSIRDLIPSLDARDAVQSGEYAYRRSDRKCFPSNIWISHFSASTSAPGLRIGGLGEF